jgi:long-chain acyl-CoA synthetase
LQRIYMYERVRGSQSFLTQPHQGQVSNWTWISAMQEVRRVAAWLTSQGWPPGSRIVILSKNCAWWIMADFAIWMAGYVSVPLFPTSRDASLVSLLNHSRPVACFVGSLDYELPFNEDIFRQLTYIVFPNTASNHMPSGATGWADIVRSETPLGGHPIREAEDVATIIYTSGTTGEPKGVMQSFRSLSLMGKSMAPIFEGRDQKIDRILSYLPLAHIAERAIVEMNGIFTPMHIFFTEGQPSFLADLVRSRCTVFFSIPRLYIRFRQGVLEKIPEKKLNRLMAVPILNRLIRRKIVRGLGLSHAHVVSGGGAATPVEIINWYRKLGVNFIEGYGMTETGITHVPLPGKFRVGFVGQASRYADTRISAEGEVQIKGPMNMLGYYRNAELTREAFTQDGYFRTGDRGEIDALGRLRLVGRLKEEFKTSKGKYVAPAQIEKRLSLFTLFESVAVFGAGMTAPFAIAVLVPGMREECQKQERRAQVESQMSAVLNDVNAQLEHHEHLRFLVLCQQPWSVESGLLTPTLKVRRPLLEQRFGQRFHEWEEAQLKVIWVDAP